VAGAEIVQDAVTFFQAFEGMEEGFRTRAGAVRELLADPATAYVLVTSARPDAVAEASFFAEKLAEREVVPAALVVNRIHPRFGTAAPALADAPPALADLEANLATLNAVADREEGSYAGLLAQVAPAPLGRIPLFGHDVHDLGGLERTADALFA
jgi:anion-transporting  ArsA/GET3 family ATPase